MRKSGIICLMLLALLLQGCTSSAPPPSSPVDISEPQSDFALRDSGMQNRRQESELVNVNVSGGFTATVEELPEKSYNGKIVILMGYQETPFILHMSAFGHNISSETFEPFSLLEAGEPYYFEIEEQLIENLPRAEMQLYQRNPKLALLNPSLTITILSVRQPAEDEYGPNSWRIVFEEV